MKISGTTTNLLAALQTSIIYIISPPLGFFYLINIFFLFCLMYSIFARVYVLFMKTRQFEAICFAWRLIQKFLFPWCQFVGFFPLGKEN